LRGRNFKAILVVRFQKVRKVKGRKRGTIAMSINEFQASRAAHETDSISFSKSYVETRGRKLMSQGLCHLSLGNPRRGAEGSLRRYLPVLEGRSPCNACVEVIQNLRMRSKVEGLLERSLIFTEADQRDLWSYAFKKIHNGRRSTKHMGRTVRKFDFENSARGRITNMPIVVMSFREEGFLEATHVTSIMEFQIIRRRAKP
jgi:hypothetical protein